MALDQHLKKGELVRKRIILSGIRIFARKGFTDTSIQEIATLCKMKRTAILHHFESKYALYEACVQQVLLNFETIGQELSSFKDDASVRLDLLFLTNKTWIERCPDDASLLVFLYYSASHDLHFKRMYSDLLANVRQRYEGIVWAGIREGLFKKTLNPQIASEMIHEHILGTLINLVSANRRSNENEILQEKWQMLLSMIKNIPGQT